MAVKGTGPIPIGKPSKSGADSQSDTEFLKADGRVARAFRENLPMQEAAEETCKLLKSATKKAWRAGVIQKLLRTIKCP